MGATPAYRSSSPRYLGPSAGGGSGPGYGAGSASYAPYGHVPYNVPAAGGVTPAYAPGVASGMSPSYRP